MDAPSSTSSSSWAWPVLVLAGALGGGAGVEAWARTSYEAPTRLESHVLGFSEKARKEDTNILVFGTCLAEIFVDEQALRSNGDPSWRVWNLGAAATVPMDWALALRNRLDPDAVDLIAFLMSPSELTEQAAPWETQVMELATWRDLPEIVGAACRTRDCPFDYGARFLFHAIRYRERIGNRAWTTLGGAGGRKPGAGRLEAASARPDPVAGAPLDPIAPPPAGGPDRDAGGGAVWLERALADARARGIPTEVIILPRRDGSHDPAGLRELERLTTVGGGLYVPTLTLAASDFADESHPTLAGARRAAVPMAAAFRAGLAAARAAP